MAFGELTARKIDFTSSRNEGMNMLNENFGKFSFPKTMTVPMTPQEAPEFLVNAKKDDGGLDLLN